MDVMTVAQTLSPSDAQAWSSTVEKIGLIGVLFFGLVAFVFVILKKYFAPWYVVEMKDVQIADLKAEKEQLRIELREAVSLAQRTSRTTREILATKQQAG